MFIARKKKCGFTLVELLVVISIIAMLLAILMPALKKARDVARSVICQARNRQIGIALNTYAEANKGYYLLHEWLYNTPGAPPDGGYWFARIAPYVDAKTKIATSVMLRCPAGDAIKEYKKEYVFGWVATDYGHQQAQASLAARANVQLSSIEKPTEFSPFFDCFYGNKNGALGFMTGDQWYGKTYSLVDSEAYVEYQSKVFRHSGNKAINALYIDGHTGSVRKRQKFWSDLDSPTSVGYDPTGASYGQDFILPKIE